MARKCWSAVPFLRTLVRMMRTADSALGELLFGRTRSRLLATLYDKPDRPFFLRQLARHIKGSASAVQRELMTLTSVGLITRECQENQVLYQANPKHPIYPELHSLLAKTAGVFATLAEAISPLTLRIEFGFVYGSFARGEENAGSDIDLMVVGEITLDDLLQCIAPVEEKLSRPVNPTIYSRLELRSKLTTGNHFLKAIQAAPLIFLIGDEDDFRKIR